MKQPPIHNITDPRGEMYRYWNKLAPAIADYRQAVALKPDFAQAYCNMAFALHAARRMNEVDGWEKAGDRWVAERIERGTASGSEKAWYGR